MGSATAYAVIGCEVTGKIAMVRRGRGCTHVMEPDRPFCGWCGKPMEVTQGVAFDDLELHQQLEAVGIKLIAGSDGRMFAGVVSTVLFAATPMRRELEFEGLEDGVQTALEPHGLWDPACFGLWAVLKYH